MAKLVVRAFSVSMDGYGAGSGQDLANPLGIGGESLHQWLYGTRTFRDMIGGSGGEPGLDDDLARRSFENVGAWIMGRNMFGPVRGPWPDEEWRGWWGENPPYHVPAFVLTRYPRDPLVMDGGTTFYFETGGIHSALERAREAAAGQDVRVGGGVSTVRQYLEAGLLDELHLAVSPVLLGSGESLFSGLDLAALGYEVVESLPSPHAMHVFLTKA
jgi:dihydrofolate reductase